MFDNPNISRKKIAVIGAESQGYLVRIIYPNTMMSHCLRRKIVWAAMHAPRLLVSTVISPWIQGLSFSTLRRIHI